MRRGTVMIMMLVAIMIGGILATRLIPSVEIEKRRQDDMTLKLNISQIRQAFDLMYLENASYNPDLSSSTFIQNELITLQSKNYLSASTLKDPTIPPHRWSVLGTDTFWRVSSNVASNTSFETLKDGSIEDWATGTVDTIATADPFYPDFTGHDDYPGQNKYGDLMGKTGQSLRITK